MRYNTMNPVGTDGSSDPRDLHDNAGVIDLLMNGPLGEYLSRLGVPLKSWRGIMQQVTDYLIAQGYESVYLTYGAGVVVERQTQLVQRDGELYRVMNAADIPLTLTGTWATDAPKLQAVGDAALRQALAAPGGAGMVGYEPGYFYPAGTVGEAIASNASYYASKNVSLLNSAYIKLRTNQVVKIVCQGDSMTAGWDNISPDKVPPTNGDSAPWHAPIQYPQALNVLLNQSTGITHQVLNRGFSGDTAKMSYNRWTTRPDADVLHLMLGINDSDGVQGATFDEYIDYMERIIRRHLDWGIGVVLHTATPRGFNSGGQQSPMFTKCVAALGKLYACPVFDSSTVVQYATFDGVYSDNTHFNAHGYNKYGNAVGAFVLAGGWVSAARMVSGEMQLSVGNILEGIGFTPRNLVVGASTTGSYYVNRATSLFASAEDRITYSFFMDTEYMEVYAVGSLVGLNIACSFTALPQYEGDTRGPASRNRPVIRSQRNRSVVETIGFTMNANHPEHVGNQLLVGLLVGRGWKNVTIWAPTTPVATRFLAGIILKERDQEDLIRPAAYSGDLGEVAGAHDDIIVYQHPYVRGAADPLPIPPAAPLPPTIYLPCPVGLLPTKSPAGSFFDCIPAELTVSGTTGFTKVMLRRTTSGTGLTVTKVAGDVAGDAFIPTAAQFVKRSYDQVTDDPTGAYVAGFAGSLENQYLQLSFGATASSHYVLTLRAPAKSQGSYASI